MSGGVEQFALRNSQRGVPAVIHARGLMRSFKTKTGVVEAVRGLDLDVAEGELVAFLGPNGAGKSTSGRKRRVDVALGLMHSPKVLFLDEPSTGLDPHSRANLWEHIVRIRKATGMTIFLTTHYLDEADSMAERVMIMDNGQVIANDTPE